MVSSVKKLIMKRRKNRLPINLQLRFLKRMQRLLSQGYPLIETLEIMKWDHSFKKISSRMVALLKSGNNLDKAFEKCGFNEAISAHLHFIRSNNDLVGSLQKCLSFFENRLSHSRKLQQTLRYPLVLFFIFTTLLVFIKQSVLPSFLTLFQSSASSSAAILFSIRLINWLIIVFFIMISALLTIFLFWLFKKKALPIKKQLFIYEKIPFVCSYIRLNTSYQLTSHMSSMLKTGMPFKEIFFHMANQDKLPILAFYSKEINKALEKGFHLNDILSKFTFLDKSISHIFQKNADYDVLEKDLDVYSEMVIDRIQEIIKKTIAFIQPVSFIMIGCFIILIYMTLMWPMFQLIQSI